MMNKIITSIIICAFTVSMAQWLFNGYRNYKNLQEEKFDIEEVLNNSNDSSSEYDKENNKTKTTDINNTNNEIADINLKDENKGEIESLLKVLNTYKIYVNTKDKDVENLKSMLDEYVLEFENKLKYNIYNFKDGYLTVYVDIQGSNEYTGNFDIPISYFRLI